MEIKDIDEDKSRTSPFYHLIFSHDNPLTLTSFAELIDIIAHENYLCNFIILGRKMKRIHKQEKEQFKKLFKQDKIDRPEDRFEILEVFLETEQHITSGELLQLLKNKGYHFTYDFVIDTLKQMCTYGFAQKNSFDNGEARYEHLHIGQHHDHMICTKCRSIFEFSNEQLENLQLQISRDYGFHILQHKMEIYGICSKCTQARTDLMPLIRAKNGERIIINSITGGSQMQMRLLTMGLRPGDIIEVITNHNMGQVVIAADSKRYVIGRGMAQKIIVKQEHTY